MRNLRKRHGNKQKGFTLIELLVVIAIIGVLSSIVMTSLAEARQKADDSKRTQDMEQLRNAAELYASKHSGQYPTIADVPSGVNFAESQPPRYSVISNILSYFTPLAYAVGNHTDAACVRFDTFVNALKSDGDISVVPMDPHNAASVTCYKAFQAADKSYTVVYGYLWEKYRNTTSGANEPSNKQVGFIVTRNAELTRAKLSEICAATRDAAGSNSYPFPVLNPYNQSTLCSGPDPDDGLIADAVLGVGGGSETLITEVSLTEVGGSCEVWSDCVTGNCNSGYCSSYGNGGQSIGTSCDYDGDCDTNRCLSGMCVDANGTCSDPVFDNYTSCTAAGSCTNSEITDHDACLNDNGYCSTGEFTDEATCVGDGGGTCSNADYTDSDTCTSYGLCNGYDSTTEENCPSVGSCTDGSSGSEEECNSSGTCDDNPSSDAYTCDSWSATYSWNEDYTWDPYTWTSSDTGNSWTPNTWTPNDWTSN